jgi:hypothetical protein
VPYQSVISVVIRMNAFRASSLMIDWILYVLPRYTIRIRSFKLDLYRIMKSTRFGRQFDCPFPLRSRFVPQPFSSTEKIIGHAAQRRTSLFPFAEIVCDARLYSNEFGAFISTPKTFES